MTLIKYKIYLNMKNFSYFFFYILKTYQIYAWHVNSMQNVRISDRVFQ